MSFINDLAFGEKLDELEIEGDLKVGGDILLQDAFPKMDQKLAAATSALDAAISVKANQTKMDEIEGALNTKADHEEVSASLSLKANQSDLVLALGLTEGLIDAVYRRSN